MSITQQVGNPQLADLADAQTGGVGGREQGAVFAIEIRPAKESLQLLDAVDLGPEDRLLHARQGLLDGGGRTVQHFAEEEPQTTDRDNEGAHRQMPFPQQMQEVGLDFFVADLVGRTMVELGETSDATDVRVLGVNRESTELDLVDELN